MRQVVMVMGLLACNGGPPPAPPASASPAPETPAAPAAAAQGPHEKDGKWVDWEPPADTQIPEGPMGDSIRRGLDLFDHTSERLPDYVGSNLSCNSCHLDHGRKDYAAKLTGVAARFPKYMGRTGAVIPLQDRVNYCFTRSLAGVGLPTDSAEMVDIINYLTFISTGVPIGLKIPATDLPKLELREADAANGEKLFTEKQCVTCHQADGGGVDGAFPALWGPKSWSVGASMTRLERAASFIKLFMPQTAPGTLSEQEAFDLAAFVNSHPRPDSPMKEKDWPTGGADADVPYNTEGHEAFRAPPLLPRANPDKTIIAPPPPAKTLGDR